MGRSALIGAYRQRHISFYKFITFLTLSLCLTMFLWNQSNWKLKCHRNHYENRENNFSELIALRRRVLQENTDESLEDILQNELSYFEVDIYSKTRKAPPYTAIYDKILEDDLVHVKPGLGENGTNATVPSHLQAEVENALLDDGWNTVLSEMISVNRSVPDNRESFCHNINYDTDTLPTLSVIIIYNNEPFTGIIRTVHSVINRTPPNLLHEVILVDDFSDRLELQEKLEYYLAAKLPRNKIRLLKLSKRSGLIRGRMIGAHVATGDVLVFLDAHCEASKDWAQPLLHRIKEKRNTVVAPVIEMIDKDTMLYARDETGYLHVGGFSWNGLFYWIKVPNYEQQRKKHHYEPTRTPVIAGGLFAVERRYFWEIGSYDSGMHVWGGENVEISLRVWLCGGSLEIIPCSRVGHIFRGRVPYKYPELDPVGVNTARVAEVWMDEYKELFYKHRVEQKGVGHGNITKRLALRKRLKCKNFQWYLDNVYKQKFKSFQDSKYYGQIRNLQTNLCLDDMQNEAQGTYFLELYTCHKKMFESQLFFLSKKQQLRKEFVCASLSDIENQVQMKECDDSSEQINDQELWEYNQFKHLIIHKTTKKCLTLKEEGDKAKAVLETCRRNRSNQHWEFI